MAEIGDNLQVCSQCGAPLEQGAAFCMECGTPVAAGAESQGAGVEEQASSAPMAGIAEDKAVGDAVVGGEAVAADSGSGPNKRWLIIGALVALVVVAIVVLIVIFALPKEDGSISDEVETSVYQEDNSSNTATGPLKNTYSTQFVGAGKDTFPTFTFSYPDGWEIADSDVGAWGETVEVRKAGSDVTVEFSYMANPASAGHAHPVSVTKVADSDFWPFYAQGENLSALGPFMVAEVELAADAANGDAYETSCYAVVPASASSGDVDVIAADQDCPGFDYCGSICMYSFVPEDGISGEDEETVIRILSSFSNGSTEEEYERAAIALQASPQASESQKDRVYVLPDSASRYYTESELATMDLYYLYLARNEIYARHGRLFKNPDLQAYFNAQPWYSGTIAPGDFSEGILNDYERKNADMILEVERSQNSPYLNS